MQTRLQNNIKTQRATKEQQQLLPNHDTQRIQQVTQYSTAQVALERERRFVRAVPIGSLHNYPEDSLSPALSEGPELRGNVGLILTETLNLTPAIKTKVLAT